MAKRRLAKTSSSEDAPTPRARKLDQIIEGLLNRLPPPGSVWPDGERHAWLDMLTAAFKVVYKDSKPEDPNSPLSTTHPISTP